MPTKKKTKAPSNDIKKSLLQQLEMANLSGAHYVDMVDDYCKLYDLKEAIYSDIEKNGIRYWTTNAKGDDIEKPNESVTNAVKVNAQMLKILADLNLKQPKPAEKVDPYKK